MLHDIPRLAPGLRLQPTPDDGPPTYFLHAGDAERRIRLPAHATYLVMLADGRATLQNVQRRARTLGMQPPDGFLEQLFAALYQLGFATPQEPAAIEHDILPGTAHTCEGCGRSCEGHLIGPLARSEVDAITEVEDALVARVPRLADERLLARLPDKDGVYLNLRDGRCVFLADDRRCDLHRHFGPDRKPSICRTFPVLRVYTGDGVRVGVGNACFRHHVHAARSIGEPARALLTGALAELPRITAYHAPFDRLPLVVRSDEDRARQARFEDTERLALGYLGRDDATLSGFLALVQGRDPLHAPVLDGRLPAEVTALCVDVVADFLDAADLDHSFLGYLRTVEGALADTYRGYLPRLEAFAAVGDAPPVSFERADEVFLLDQLRRLLWLREVLRFDTPHHAFAAFLVGWVTCLALHPEGGAERADRMGEDFTAWFRLMTEDDLHRQLFDALEDALEVLRACAGQTPAAD